jgi:hypothetical protein
MRLKKYDIKCHTDDQQILDTTVQKLSSHGKLEPGFCPPVFMAVRTTRLLLLPTTTTDSLKIGLHFTDTELTVHHVINAQPRVSNYCITVELYLTELIGTTSHPDMHKIRIIEVFFLNTLHWQFEVERKKNYKRLL